MQASGIITLTTDFGHKGPFTAVMKGVILGRFPAARVIDMGHDIPAQWPPEAGFWVERAYAYFPKGTVHLAIVDPGVGTEREILVVEADGHVFLAPDNGLLGLLLDHAEDAVVRHVAADRLREIGVSEPSATFHGRDIFAPIAAEIAAGRREPADFGPVVNDWIPGWVEEPECVAGRISGSIVTVDTFGNLISNIDSALVEALERPAVRVAQLELPLEETYGKVTPGDYLALVNSFGVIEIARAEGDAAQGLGLGRGAPVSVIDLA
jgi:S-adenosylmethionine hydrolase